VPEFRPARRSGELPSPARFVDDVATQSEIQTGSAGNCNAPGLSFRWRLHAPLLQVSA